ncbi:MAG: C-terminal binding protein [Planctomycetota bacterium]
MAYKVIATDIAWPEPRVEREVLGRAGAELVLAKSGEEQELLELVSEADAILTCWKLVTQNVIDAAPKCIIISRYGVGLDNIAVPHATKRGIIVTNVPEYCLEEVSDHAIALILTLARKTALYDRTLRGGVYDREAGYPMRRLKGLAVGVVGLGKIGRLVTRKARGLGFRVLASDPAVSAEEARSEGATLMSYEDLLSQADFVTLHAPLTGKTRHMIGARALGRMKKTAFLVNTSRGPLVDEEALHAALEKGIIAGAGLDVFEEEPVRKDSAILEHPNVVVTPHAAFLSEESVVDLETQAAQHVVDALEGRRPGDIVNGEVLKQGNLRAKFKR